MSITITIAELPSTNASAVTWVGASGTPVATILSEKGINYEGKVLKLNSVEVSGASAATTDGMLTVTQGAKGNTPHA